MTRIRLLLLAGLLVVPARADAADLVLQRVMLSTAGIGYFEYAAEVDGPATLGLDVPLSQVDDVLMSLVVFDSAGGVGGVELPGRDDTHAAFGNVPFGPDALNSPLDFLNGLQGVVIDVHGPRPMSGRLLHVDQVTEHPPAPAPADSVVTRTRVSVLTETGLAQFVLEEADSVQVADPALRAGIVHALDSLRGHAAADVRHLTIRAAGTGQRSVRVGYVAAAPLWKTSYRLALPSGDGPARLQGWAVLENASAADWNGVALTLQSGNPVTFRQAIYQSYFVERPEVPVEVLNRILPLVDTAEQLDQALKAPSQTRGLVAPAAAPPPPMMAPAPAAAIPGSAAPMAGAAEPAAAAEGAEQTSFTLAGPVILAVGHTASVPILDTTVPGERLDLLAAGAAHPLAAVRLANQTGTSLPAGVLTLYETAADGSLSFAGNARLGGLPMGETRLLSFAEDLRTAAIWQRRSSTSLAGLSAAGGTLRTQERQRSLFDVTIAAPAAEARSILLEIPKTPDATLVPLDAPAPSGETATAWRVPVTLKAGETRHLIVAVDRLVSGETVLTEGQPTFLRFLNEEGLSPAAAAALRHLVDLRSAEASAVAGRDSLRAQRAALDADEDRVRRNLAAVPAGDALHGRLVRQLEADETQIAALQAAMAGADAAVEQAHRALVEGIQKLSI